MIDSRILNVISTLLEIAGEGDEIIISARIRPEHLDELAAVGSELEELEDEGHDEPESFR